MICETRTSDIPNSMAMSFKRKPSLYRSIKALLRSEVLVKILEEPFKGRLKTSKVGSKASVTVLFTGIESLERGFWDGTSEAGADSMSMLAVYQIELNGGKWEMLGDRQFSRA